MKILAINPGSTSTKVALFDNGKEIWSDTQRYDIDVIRQYSTVADQEELRHSDIRKAIAAHGTGLSELDAVVGRGGVLKPVSGGTYIVNEAMLDDLNSGKYGEHACNLGAVLAKDLADEGGCRQAFIVDPPVVDEMLPEARLSGLPAIDRISMFHALNQKAVAHRAASELGIVYEKANFIVAHMGGGISVGAHERGRVVDVNNALDGDGPFSPERAGGLPTGGLVRLSYSGKFDLEEMKKKLVGHGGLVAHLGTNDLREVQKMIDSGDERAALVFDAMAYQVAKEIGARAVILNGRVDAIVLTGGLAYSDRFIDRIHERVSFLARILVYPGEDELRALAEGAMRVLKGAEEARNYEA